MSAPRYGGWTSSSGDRVTSLTPLDTRGPKRLWTREAGWVPRDRGDVGRVIVHDYLCPVHGRFEARASSDDVPDEMPCPVRVAVGEGALPPDAEALLRQCYEPTDIDAAIASDPCAVGKLWAATGACGLTSPWSPSRVSVWPSAGETKA